MGADDSTDQPSPDPRLRRQFDYYRKRLAEKGVYAGTHHKRIVIDKTRMGLEHLKQLGFVPVKVAIPEAGQDQLTSYRHPNNNFHIHSHPGVWTMHEDEHPAATMIMKSRPTLLGKAMALAEGVPHAITEGVPGAAIYLKNQAKGFLPNGSAANMLQAISRDRETSRTEKRAYTARDALMLTAALGAGGALASGEGHRRRGFLQGAGAGLGGLTALSTLGRAALEVRNPLLSAGAVLAATGLGASSGFHAGDAAGSALENRNKEAYELGSQQALSRFGMQDALLIAAQGVNGR